VSGEDHRLIFEVRFASRGSLTFAYILENDLKVRGAEGAEKS